MKKSNPKEFPATSAGPAKKTAIFSGRGSQKLDVNPSSYKHAELIRNDAPRKSIKYSSTTVVR